MPNFFFRQAFTIMVTYWVYSPIIPCIAAIYFFLVNCAFRYLILYVHRRVASKSRSSDLALLRPSRGRRQQSNAAKTIEDGLRLLEFGRRPQVHMPMYESGGQYPRPRGNLL